MSQKFVIEYLIFYLYTAFVLFILTCFFWVFFFFLWHCVCICCIITSKYFDHFGLEDRIIVGCLCADRVARFTFNFKRVCVFVCGFTLWKGGSEAKLLLLRLLWTQLELDWVVVVAAVPRIVFLVLFHFFMHSSLLSATPPSLSSSLPSLFALLQANNELHALVGIAISIFISNWALYGSDIMLQ